MKIDERIFGKNKNALEFELAFQFCNGESAGGGICSIIIDKMTELDGLLSAKNSTELARKMAGKSMSSNKKHDLI